ncbi:hypothetical protein X975_19149, partial [Stegodyphus mimosarum]
MDKNYIASDRSSFFLRFPRTLQHKRKKRSQHRTHPATRLFRNEREQAAHFQISRWLGASETGDERSPFAYLRSF